VPGLVELPLVWELLVAEALAIAGGIVCIGIAAPAPD